jgi:hypothetical protein
MKLKYGQCVVATYDLQEKAEEALQILSDAGVPHEHVSLIAQQVKGAGAEAASLQMGDRTEAVAAKGAGIGGLVGLLLGAPLLAIPGVGLVLAAGPIAMGLTGALVGGFLGAMQGWGVEPDHIDAYEERVRAGKTLVIVTGAPRDVAQAVRLLQTTDALSVETHAESPSDDVEA